MCQQVAPSHDYRGITKVLPLRMTSLVSPFAALIFATEVPYFRARPHSVSLPLTVTFTLPPPELDDVFFLDDDEDEATFFTGVEFTRRVLLDEEERFAGGSSRSGN